MTDYAELLSRVSAPTGSGREISDPATGELIGRAPVQTIADLEARSPRLTRAQPAWDALGHAERSELLNAAADRSMRRPRRSPSCSRANRASR